jgi:hypothetical protein
VREGPRGSPVVPVKLGRVEGAFPKENDVVDPNNGADPPPGAEGALPPVPVALVPNPLPPNVNPLLPNRLGGFGGVVNGLTNPLLLTATDGGGSANENPPVEPMLDGLNEGGGSANENPDIAGPGVGVAPEGGLDPIPKVNGFRPDAGVEVDDAGADPELNVLAHGFAMPTLGFSALGVVFPSSSPSFFPSAPSLLLAALPVDNGARPKPVLSFPPKLDNEIVGPVVRWNGFELSKDPPMGTLGAPNGFVFAVLVVVIEGGEAPKEKESPAGFEASPLPGAVPEAALPNPLPNPNNPPGLLASGVLPGQLPNGLIGLGVFATSAPVAAGEVISVDLVPNGEPEGPPVIGPNPGNELPPNTVPFDGVGVNEGTLVVEPNIFALLVDFEDESVPDLGLSVVVEVKDGGAPNEKDEAAGAAVELPPKENDPDAGVNPDGFAVVESADIASVALGLNVNPMGLGAVDAVVEVVIVEITGGVKPDGGFHPPALPLPLEDPDTSEFTLTVFPPNENVAVPRGGLGPEVDVDVIEAGVRAGVLGLD